VHFRWLVTVETSIRPFTVVWVEECGQTGLQLTNLAKLVEINVLISYTVPLTFADDVVEGAASAILADPNVGSAQAMNASAVSYAPWSVLKIFGATIAEIPAQGIETEGAVQGEGELPSEHVVAVPVDDATGNT